MLKKFLIVSLVFISLNTIANTDTTRPQKWGEIISQEHNFYQISPTVFRSEQPSNQILPLLQQQNIDVVINLRTSNKDEKVLKDTPIKLVHIPVKTWAMSKEDLLEVMKTIQLAQQNDQKVLIHCYHGSDRTGTSIAMYRIIFENWSTEDALYEMKYGGYGFHSIWRNLEKLFTPKNIKWIQQELSNPS